MKELISLVKELINNEENMFFPSAIESGGGRGSTNFEKWREKAIAALAELEKPAECSAKEAAYDIEQECFYTFPDGGHNYEKKKAAMIIEQYAETYHAKKCAEIAEEAERFYRDDCGGCGEPCVGLCDHIRQLKTIITGKPHA